MNHQHEDPRRERNGAPFRAKWVVVAFAAIAAYFLITEHGAHLSGYLYYLPFLLVLACPLLHMFMHGGHGRDGSDTKDGKER